MKAIIIDFIENNWSWFVSHAESHGLSEDEAETMFEDYKRGK